MITNPPHRVLIVGSGSIGQRHLRICRDLLPDSSIAVLCRKESRSLNVDSVSIFHSIDEALNFKPSCAVIANPSSLHLKVAKPLADAGIHLLIEKPLSHDTVGASQFIQSCKDKSSLLMVGYNLRFLPSLRKFRNLIHSGFIGEPLSVRCEIGQYLPSWRPSVDYRNSVSASRYLGGGVLLELSHEIDYLRWLFGEVSWVQASLLKQSNLEIDVEDTAHLLLGFTSPLFSHSIIANLTMDFYRHDTTRYCTVVGQRGSLRWDGLTGQVDSFQLNQNSWSKHFKHSPDRDFSYIKELTHFFNCISSNSNPLITGSDALSTLDVISSARSSSHSNGARITVQYSNP